MSGSAHYTALPPEEAKQLLKLCEAGRLYDVEKWINSGKSIRIPPEVKKTPVEVALKKGFHSLVELLLRNEEEPEVKNRALEQAVWNRRLDLVELIVSLGADIRALDFASVLLCWHPQIIRFFLDRGADVITDSPFAWAFRDRVRTALGPYLAAADMALRQACHDGDLKWVSLLLWAGADPRSNGPTFDYLDDPEMSTTGLKEACSSGHIEILEKLRPDPSQDDLSELLSDAAFGRNDEVVSYLLDLGADPNDKPNGGSSALDRCISYLRFEDSEWIFRGRRYRTPKYAVPNTTRAIRLLIENGAVWKPNDRSQLNDVRRTLYGMEADVTLELLKLFLSTKLAPRTHYKTSSRHRP